MHVRVKLQAMAHDLETVPGRIQHRLEVVRKSAHAASIEATGSPSAIPNIINGRSQNPRIDTLTKLAPVLRTTPEWLMSRQGPEEAPADDVASAPAFVPADIEVPSKDSMPRDLPVYGTAMGSLVDGVEGVELFSSMPADLVRRPPALMGVPDAYALYVTGDSMYPAHPHGALRMVHPHRPFSPGDTVIVQTKHYEHGIAQGYIKTFRRRAGGMLVLEQLNPEATIQIPLQFVVSVHKVMDMNDLFGV